MSQALGPVVLDLEGIRLSQKEREMLRRPSVGGVILFARNYQDKPQLIDLVSDIRAERHSLLIAVDQEGGRVQRFKEGFTRLPPMQVFSTMFQDKPEQALQLVKDCGWLMAVEILACGLDFSLAPVLDVDRNYCLAIGNRAFSGDADEVVTLAEAFIDGMHEAGMAATGKHFPGHGSVQGDTHLSSPIDSRGIELIQSTDMRPFAALASKVEAMMPAHVIFSGVDDKPVGYSERWLKTILRGKLGFGGLVFSDDLSMEAAAFAGSYEDRAFAAMAAGCDMVLVCNQPQGAKDVVDAFDKQGVKASSGLSIMRAKKAWDWAALKELDRWVELNRVLSNMC